jgi:hypothetical protein
LPPIPHHPEPHTYKWTKLEEEAIRDYGRQCVEAAADIVENWDTPDCGGWTAGDIVDAIRNMLKEAP